MERMDRGMADMLGLLGFSLASNGFGLVAC